MTQLEAAFEQFQHDESGDFAAINDVLQEMVSSDHFANFFCNAAEDPSLPPEAKIATIAAAMFKFGQSYMASAAPSEASRPPERLKATSLIEALKLIQTEGPHSPGNTAALEEISSMHNLRLVVKLLQCTSSLVAIHFLASILRAGKILGRDEAMREMLEKPTEAPDGTL